MPMPIVAAADRGVPRRAFLHQLCGLPLIGGGLTLLGAPRAVAVPATRELLENYNMWLWGEHCRCAAELQTAFGADADVRFTHLHNAGAAFHCKPDWNQNQNVAPPSTRAALVLAAVGCDWKEWSHA